MSEGDLDDGRIPLPRPTREVLENAAEIILGDQADECFLGNDGMKILRGQGRLWIQIPPEETAMPLDAAPGDYQDRLLWEASKIRAAKIREEGEKYLDPRTNPMIKVD